MTDQAEPDLPPTGTRTRARARTRARTLSRVVAGVVVLLCLLSLLARPLGVSGWPLVAQVISLKVLLGLSFLVLALLVAGIAALRRRLRTPLVLIASAALLVTGAIHVGTVLARGGGVTPVDDADLTVVEFNAFDTATTAVQLAELVRSTHADIAVLPEADPAATGHAVGLLADGGLRYRMFTTSTTGPYPVPLSVLVLESLGDYRQPPGPRLRYGSLRLEPATVGSPTIVAVHPTDPGLRSSLADWRAETTTATRQCAPGSGVIVAGDFNATVDHPAFADLPCIDAATQAGAGSAGTWPSWMPSVMAAPIDHVVVDPQTYRSVASWTVRVGASDHRALVVQLEHL